MTSSIYGYQQDQLIQYVDEIEDSHGKMKTIRIDCTDLCIMRWLANFIASGKMKHHADKDGNLYYLFTYNKILSDLPILNISKAALRDRIRKLEHFKIMETICERNSTGTYLYVRFLDNYYKLSYANGQGDVSSNGQGGIQTLTPHGNKLDPKDNKLKNNKLNIEKKNTKKKVDEPKLEW